MSGAGRSASTCRSTQLPNDFFSQAGGGEGHVARDRLQAKLVKMMAEQMPSVAPAFRSSWTAGRLACSVPGRAAPTFLGGYGRCPAGAEILGRGRTPKSARLDGTGTPGEGHDRPGQGELLGVELQSDRRGRHTMMAGTPVTQVGRHLPSFRHRPGAVDEQRGSLSTLRAL